MSSERIDVIATTVSGSIQDWKKVERIVPLFREHGITDVHLHVVESHRDARMKARQIIEDGGRIPISAGGSGTFRNVLEGCIDSKVRLDELRLGFLRKGSADLIGKVLDMPDTIDEAIAVFADSIRSNATLPCDILLAESTGGGAAPMHFVGYGGAEIFGRIPHFTENRFMKWYKGVLGQIFGDLGPFTTGMILALAERVATAPFRKRLAWTIRVDGVEVAQARYQALIIVNGHLGPDLPFASDPLGSGHFHLFALKDLGMIKLPRQALRARDGSIMEEPDTWGLESYTAERSLELKPETTRAFEANVDGATLPCVESLRVRIVGRIPLIARRTAAMKADAGSVPETGLRTETGNREDRIPALP